MTEAYQPHTEAALDIVREEIEYATVEKAAFERLHSRVGEIDPVTTSVNSATTEETVGVLVHSQRASADTALQRVKNAYQETVMDVPHYESEYGEPFEKNVAAEFGKPIAIRLVEGKRLTPTLYETLLNAVAKACEERRSFLELLREERESLREIKEVLNECETRTVTIGQQLSETPPANRTDLHAELCSIEAECEALSKERQGLLHGRSVSDLSGITVKSLTGFLYGPCETTCPALADIADCLDTVRYYKAKAARPKTADHSV